MFRAIKSGFVIIFTLVLLVGFAYGIHILTTWYTWVVVATVNLSTGMPITNTVAQLRPWLSANVPIGAVRSTAEAHGLYARRNIPKGEAIIPSDLTNVTPPPVRTEPRWGYSILWFRVPQSDVAEVFVGDRVDLTRTTSILHGSVPITTRGWLVHHIDFEEPSDRKEGRARVFLEIKNEEMDAAWGYPIGHPKHAIRPSPWWSFEDRMEKSSSR